MAVLALAFVSVGAMATESDADPVTYDFAIIYDGLITDEDSIKEITAIGGTITYIATLDDDLEDEITVINLKYYEALDEATLAVNNAQIDGAYVEFTDAVTGDYKNAIKAFTSATFSKTGKLIGGVDTKVTFAGALSPADGFTDDVVIEMVSQETIEQAIADAVVGLFTAEDMAEAVAEAVAQEKAKSKDYIYTQAEYDAAKATVPAGYISQADADKAVADAKAGVNNSNETTIWMAIAIVFGVATIALALYTIIGIVNKSKEKAKAKKDEKKESA